MGAKINDRGEKQEMPKNRSPILNTYVNAIPMDESIEEIEKNSRHNISTLIWNMFRIMHRKEK